MLIETTHVKPWSLTKEVRYTDTTISEQERGISITSTPISLLLGDSNEKSWLLNFVDTPGHISLTGEVTAALRIADGCVVCVDVVEGVMLNTERCIRQCVAQNIPMLLAFTKMDRLITDLKMPPVDAYFKLIAMLEEVPISGTLFPLGQRHSRFLRSRARIPAVKPRQQQRVLLQRAAQVVLHAPQLCRQVLPAVPRENHGGAAREAAVGQRVLRPLDAPLRGPRAGRPHAAQLRGVLSGADVRVLSALNRRYKIYARVLGAETAELAPFLRELGVSLTKEQLRMDALPLLKLVLSGWFGGHGGVVDSIVEVVPSPIAGAERKVRRCWKGDEASEVCQAMSRCDPKGPLVIHVVKMFPTPDASDFVALGRVFSGTVKPGMEVDVLGSSFSAENEEDLLHRTVQSVAVSQGRFHLAVTQCKAGNWVLLGGLGDAVQGIATVVGRNVETTVFCPLEFDTQAVVKLSIEPRKPSELPIMVDALRKVTRCYPLVSTRKEESGEYVLLGTGELQLDCAMHDLRHVYSHIDIKVAVPVVRFTETVQEPSSLLCFAETPNRMNRLAMTAEPLERGLADAAESGQIVADWPAERLEASLTAKFGWDKLAARSFWAFGPEAQGANALLDDTLASEVDKTLLSDVRESVVKGFRWACSGGPLCEEPMRNVKFKILDAMLADTPVYRGRGQLIPTARRVAYSAFLLASPRLMEPFFQVEIQTPPDLVSTCEEVLSRRRGFVRQSVPKPGTPFISMKGYIPAMDSFGFETDLRVSTSGLAFPQTVFSHWEIVPGDPLDRSVKILPLEASSGYSLARDFMLKTRRRKGLSEDVSLKKFFDEAMLLQLASQENEIGVWRVCLKSVQGCFLHVLLEEKVDNMKG